MRVAGPKEKLIVAAVKRYLQYKENLGELYFIRNNTGATRMGRTLVRFGKAGSSDIIVFRRGGKAIFFEVKREGEGQNDNQIDFQQKIEALGYNYYIINNLDQVRELIP